MDSNKLTAEEILKSHWMELFTSETDWLNHDQHTKQLTKEAMYQHTAQETAEKDARIKELEEELNGAIAFQTVIKREAQNHLEGYKVDIEMLTKEVEGYRNQEKTYEYACRKADRLSEENYGQKQELEAVKKESSTYKTAFDGLQGVLSNTLQERNEAMNQRDHYKMLFETTHMDYGDVILDLSMAIGILKKWCWSWRPRKIKSDTRAFITRVLAKKEN